MLLTHLKGWTNRRRVLSTPFWNVDWASCLGWKRWGRREITSYRKLLMLTRAWRSSRLSKHSRINYTPKSSTKGTSETRSKKRSKNSNRSLSTLDKKPNRRWKSSSNSGKSSRKSSRKRRTLPSICLHFWTNLISFLSKINLSSI